MTWPDKQRPGMKIYCFMELPESAGDGMAVRRCADGMRRERLMKNGRVMMGNTGMD